MIKEEIANNQHLSRDVQGTTGVRQADVWRKLRDSPVGLLFLGWEHTGCVQGTVRSPVWLEQLKEVGE